jgi:hypothetical protein
MPDTAKTINFDKLWHMLRSKDKQLLTDMEWMFDQEFRFLNGQKDGTIT